MNEFDGWQAGEHDSLELPAALTELPALRDFVAVAGQRGGISPEDCARLTLVFEELFVNSVTHGRATRVSLGWRSRGGGVMAVDYRDDGAPFNALTDGPAAPATEAAALEYLAERVGGVGLWVLRHYARGAAYWRSAEGNRLCFLIGRAAVDQTKM